MQGNNFSLSNNGKTIIKTGSNDWNCTCLGNVTLVPRKINIWKIKNNKTIIRSNFMIGIAEKDLYPKNTNNYLNSKVYSLYSYSGYKYIKGSSSEFWGREIKENEIVTIIYDLIKGELSFRINNELPKIAYSDLPCNIDYVPYIESYFTNDVVELIE